MAAPFRRGSAHASARIVQALLYFVAAEAGLAGQAQQRLLRKLGAIVGRDLGKVKNPLSGAPLTAMSDWRVGVCQDKTTEGWITSNPLSVGVQKFRARQNLIGTTILRSLYFLLKESAKHAARETPY